MIRFFSHHHGSVEIFPKWKGTNIPIGSMGLVYLPTWMVDIYGFHAGIYTIPMDASLDRRGPVDPEPKTSASCQGRKPHRLPWWRRGSQTHGERGQTVDGCLLGYPLGMYPKTRRKEWEKNYLSLNWWVYRISEQSTVLGCPWKLVDRLVHPYII